MTKKLMTTYDQFVESLDAKQRKQLNEEYRELLLSELLIALMKDNETSIRKLAKAANISTSIIQGLRSAAKKNLTLQTLIKIIDAFGYSLILEKSSKKKNAKNRIVLYNYVANKEWPDQSTSSKAITCKGSSSAKDSSKKVFTHKKTEN